MHLIDIGSVYKRETMSYIYAEKMKNPNTNRNHISIFGDTKIEYGNNSKANISDVQYNLIKKYGIIKNNICCPELCISFAGNDIIHASILFNKLNQIKKFEIDDVIDFAYSIHKSATFEDDIEFLIAYYSDEDKDVHIYCIKEGEKKLDVQFAWIGSPIARRFFLNRRNYYNDNETILNHQITDFSRLAFQDVVSGCGDNSVGGFFIELSYDYSANTFVYNDKLCVFSSKEQHVCPNECINFFTSASDGGYTCSVQQIDSENVIISIEQMNHMILFSRKYRSNQADADNEYLFPLILPMEVFVDKDGTYKRFR